MNMMSSILICPSCKSSLQVAESTGGAVGVDKQLNCNKCAKIFPIIGNVPRLLDNTQFTRGARSAFGLQWKTWLEGKLDKDRIYGIDLAKEVREFHQYCGIPPEEFAGKTVLDAGCG